jgi:acyl-homoserine-lactone acylase
MNTHLIAGLTLAILGWNSALQASPKAKCAGPARNITITRDDWGVVHAKGRTDADAVFGMIYAQAEDDFDRIESNYLTSLGRLAEAEGESALWQDLRQRLFIDPDKLKTDYSQSPDWLRKLTGAWSDGLNCYLATHPETHPRVLEHFEPWMALSFSEGSIGGDIEYVTLPELRAFYDKQAAPSAAAWIVPRPRALQGSNGFAIAPSQTQHGYGLLLINPHTTFFFRSELQVTSSEGLNAYGAVTWGQFFIYQGFNEKVGWMHTSSGVDSVDEFAETIVAAPNGQLSYRYGSEQRPIETKPVTLRYRAADGTMSTRTFSTYATHHGPIVRAANGKWIAIAMMNMPVPALEQSFLRTKATDYDSFIQVAQRRANSTNNTILADSKGEIAYLHPQFVPIRDNRFDYRGPVDGSDPATDWKGLHTLESLPHAVRPANGWVMNTNNAPWTAAGADSPKAANYPRYMDQWGEDPRGLHAERVLNSRRDFSPETLMKAAFDPYLPAFARFIPLLAAAYDRLPASDPMRERLAGPVELLRGWDCRWSLDSKPTSLAVFFADALWEVSSKPADELHLPTWEYMADRTSDAQKLAALAAGVNRLTEDFGGWKVPWSEINRYQRNDGAVVQKFDDSKGSIPIAFTSNEWGSLAAFEAKRYPGTKRHYGTSGNSFVAVVEFGPKVRAWAVTTGGESGHRGAKHFEDQVQRYAEGNLRPVYFYPGELKGHVERIYQPVSNSPPHWTGSPANRTDR